MTTRVLADGTIATSFRIGSNGAEIFQGPSLPSNALGRDGDVYLRTGANANWYTRVAGVWTSLSVPSTVAAQVQMVMRGLAATIDPNATYVGVSADTLTADNEKITADQTDITADSLPDTHTDLILASRPEGSILTIKDESSPAGTYPIHVIGQATTIDGASTGNIFDTGGAFELIYSGGQWRLISVI